MIKNGGPPNAVMHVDQSLKLWAFVDVYGITRRVRMLASRTQTPPQQKQSNPPAPMTSPAPQPVQSPQQQQQVANHSNSASKLAYEQLCEMARTAATSPAVCGGTVLVVNLPPQSAYPSPSSQPPQTIYASSASHWNSVMPAGSSRQSSSPPPQPGPPALTGTMASTGSSTYVDPVSYQSLDGTLTSQVIIFAFGLVICFTRGEIIAKLYSMVIILRGSLKSRRDMRGISTSVQ